MSSGNNESFNFDDFDLNIESNFIEIADQTIKGEIEKQISVPKNREEEKMFIHEVIKLLTKNWTSINSALTNIKNSKIFDITGDPSENRNIMANIQRDFDQDIHYQIENIEYKHKEITSHPKSITFYTLNYSKSQRETLKGIVSDKHKFDLILSWEMQNNLSQFVTTFIKMISELLTLMNTKTTAGHVKMLNSVQQQMFEDAKQVCLICMRDIDQIRRLVSEWKSVSHTF
jgi:hypothetical protein